MSSATGLPGKRFSELHRSMRFADTSGVALSLSIIAAIGLSVAGVYFASQIVGIHQQIVHWILAQAGIPLAGVVAFPDYSGEPGLEIATGAITAVVLLGMYLLVKMSRTLVILFLALLGASVLNLSLGGGFGADARAFTALWLRFEFVAWIAIPWLMAVFAGLIMPAGWAPLFWTIMPPFYAIVWSAVRLAFCLGVLQFTGPLLGPVLWFGMGALADMLYISAFYSFIAGHGSHLRRTEVG